VRLRAPGDFAGDFQISKMPLLRSRMGARSNAGGFWIEEVSCAVNANPLPCFHIASFDKTGNP
jgi:hypothetical protein